MRDKSEKFSESARLLRESAWEAGMAILTPVQIALKAEMEKAILAEVVRSGLDGIRPAAIVHSFEGRGVSKSEGG